MTMCMGFHVRIQRGGGGALDSSSGYTVWIELFNMHIDNYAYSHIIMQGRQIL